MFESEERQIVERVKDFMKSKESLMLGIKIIMLRNGRILRFDDYLNMINAGKINPKDAYVYISTYWTAFKITFRYPFLFFYGDLLNAYLSKLGFYYEYFIAPATGLKYVTVVLGLYHEGYLSIDVSDLLTVVNNTNLPKIVFEVVGDKIISGEKELTKDEYEKILGMFKSQRLFVGHNVGEAFHIIHDYYYNDNQSLAKEAARIAMDYDRIFNPYRVCFDTKTWKEVDCWSIKF